MADSYLAACAIFRNETPYLAEWIDFHRLAGVERFFLYDNGSDDAPETVLAPYVAEGSVSVRPWPTPYRLQAARLAYEDCLGRVRGRVRWLACIDVDEFLFSPRQWTLLPTLRRFEEFPGVVVRWQVYGSSGHERASAEPVIARFNRRAPTEWIRNRRVKSIVDPARALRPVNTHHFVYEGGELAVDESGARVDLLPRPRFKKRLRPLYRLLGPALRHFDPWAGADITNSTVSVEHLRINHYPIKSREEFERKARLKEGKGRYDSVDYFAYHDRNDVLDPILAPYLPQLGKNRPVTALAANARP
jgi:Glycosyltransferase family 92